VPSATSVAKLSLLVEFPDRPPAILAGLGENPGEAKGGKNTKKKSGAPAKSNSGSRHAT
jgi:hypothetical protein